MNIVPLHAILKREQKQAYLFAITTIFITFILFALSWVFVTVVDPYAEHGQDNGLYLASSPATVDRYKERLQQEPYTLVFGTSRSHLISDDLLGESVLNLHAIYGWPISVRTFLQSLSPQEVSHIRRIIYLLDFHTFGTMPPEDRYAAYGPVARALYKAKGMRAYLADSWDKLKAERTPALNQRIHARGFKIELQPHLWDGQWREDWDSDRQNVIPEQFTALADVQAFAKEHGLKIDFITPTVPCLFTRKIDRQKLVDLRKNFVRVLGSYIEMTTLPGISDHQPYFADSFHLNYPGWKKVYSAYPWTEHIIDQTNVDKIEDLMFRKGCE